MTRDHLGLKILILVAVGSYFAYCLYWFVKAFPWFVYISLGPENYSAPTGLRFTNTFSLLVGYLTDYSAFFGLAVRVIGAFYALISTFLIVKGEGNMLLVRDKIARTLLFEGIYFLSLIPAIFFLLGFSALIPEANIFLSLQLFTQILLISPFLILLSRKIKNNSDSSAPSILKLAALSSLSYMVALWGIYMFKWIGMMAEARALGDPNWLQFGIRIFGLQNTVTILSLSVVFAIVGTLKILRKSGGDKSRRWWGLSLIFLSVHFIVYVFYVASVGFWDAILYGEVWTIPLLGLGIYLLLKNPKIQ